MFHPESPYAAICADVMVAVQPPPPPPPAPEPKPTIPYDVVVPTQRDDVETP